MDFADTLKGVHPCGSVWEAVEKGQTDVVLEALRKGAGGITLDATDPHETAGKTVRLLTYADVC